MRDQDLPERLIERIKSVDRWARKSRNWKPPLPEEINQQLEALQLLARSRIESVRSGNVTVLQLRQWTFELEMSSLPLRNIMFDSGK